MLRPACLVAIGVALALNTGAAVAVDVDWNQSIDNNYANPDNWSTGFRPAFFLNEVAVIGNATAPVGNATVASSVLDNPAGVILGQGVGTTGTLNITGGGTLNVVPGTIETGAVVIGGGGVGTLNLDSTGVLNAQTLTVSNRTAQLNVAGAAQLSLAAGATLGGDTRISGSSVDFSVGGDLVFESTGTYVPEITGPTHSTIDVTGAVTLSGALDVDLSGHTPFLGDTWDLIDATSVSGDYASVSVTGFTLGPNEQLVTRTIADPSSTNGQFVRLSYEEIEPTTPMLVLRVDPTTGRAELFNDSGQFPAEIQGYDIMSASGSLLPEDGDWLSLDDDDRAGGDWRESNVSTNQLAELKQDGATTVLAGGATVFDLGNLYNVGVGGADLVLRYLEEGRSEPTLGAVVYEPIEAGVVGDYNDDGVVDAADYAIWRENLGASVTLPNERPDAATPGLVDAEDLAAWRDNFGAAAASSLTATPAPEATTAWLILSGAATFAAQRRRREGRQTVTLS